MSTVNLKPKVVAAAGPLFVVPNDEKIQSYYYCRKSIVDADSLDRFVRSCLPLIGGYAIVL